jgi:hypothetical protein
MLEFRRERIAGEKKKFSNIPAILNARIMEAGALPVAAMVPSANAGFRFVVQNHNPAVFNY